MKDSLTSTFTIDGALFYHQGPPLVALTTGCEDIPFSGRSNVHDRPGVTQQLKDLRDAFAWMNKWHRERPATEGVVADFENKVLYYNGLGFGKFLSVLCLEKSFFAHVQKVESW